MNNKVSTPNGVCIESFVEFELNGAGTLPDLFHPVLHFSLIVKTLICSLFIGFQDFDGDEIL